MENTKKCPFCAEEINSEAKICKHCWKNVNTEFSINKVIWIILFILFWVGIIFYISDDWLNIFNTSKQLNNISRDVAIDFEEQYKIAKSWWDLIDICVNAWIVKAWYLQAKDEYSYNKWLEIEKEDCEKAWIN